VTHLVVEPKHRQGLGRLVPLDLVSGTATQVRLSCTQEEFQRLDSAEETQFIRAPPDSRIRPARSCLAVLRPGRRGPDPRPPEPGVSATITFDTVPAGDAGRRRGDTTRTDGAIGHVHGLVIGTRPVNHVTACPAAEGHLWGHKDVAIPVSAVVPASAADRAAGRHSVSITRDQVKDLLRWYTASKRIVLFYLDRTTIYLIRPDCFQSGRFR